MSPILEYPEVRYLGKDEGWVLDEDLDYYHPSYGIIRVEKGFETDLDSIPRLPFAYWLTKNACVLAAVIHDWLYKEGEINDRVIERGEADDIMFGIMEEEGVSWWQRRMIRFGLRIGGWIAWNKHREKDAAKFDDGHNPPPPRKPPSPPAT